MADTTLESLTLATLAELSDDDLVYMVNSPGSSPAARGLSLQKLRALMGDSLGNQATADQTINAATEAYLVGSNISIPVDKLRIGTVLKWTISLSKTAAGTAANTFNVRLGTAGTTADTAVLAFTTGTATGVVDQGIVEIVVTVRGPLSASGVLQGYMRLTHELASTGLHNKASRVHHVTSAAFNVTTANLIIGVSCLTAASTVLTFQQVIAEAKNL